MSQIVKLRRSSVSGQKPTNSNLQLGELALNTTDGKVYMAKSGSLGPSVEELISTNTVNTGSISLSGSLNITGSTTQVGNNTLLGNTELSGSVIISGSVQHTGSLRQSGDNTFIGNTLISGSFVVSGSYPPGSPSASMKVYGNTEIDGYAKFLPVTTNLNTSLSGSYIFTSGSTDDLYFAQNGKGYSNVTRLRWLEGNLYTGLLNGGVITATAGGTTFNVAAGSGVVVNLNASLTENPFPTIKYVNWNTFTGQTLTYRTTHIQTFIGINDNGEIIQQTGAFNDGQYNTTISLGTVLHQNLSTVNASITYPNMAYGYKQRTYDFIKAFGPLKLSGLEIVPTGTLGLNVGSGTAWADGRNYQVDPNNPSYITDTGTAVSKIFRYYQISGTTFSQDTNNASGYTTLDVTNYNNNGTLTEVPGNNVNNYEWSIQRIFWYPNSATKGIVAYYGNRTYTSATEAAANVQFEPFVEVENTKQNAVYLGAIAVRKDADWADSTTYLVLPGGIFRNVGGSGGGGSVPTGRLTDLTDVDVAGATNGDIVSYNTTSNKWEHGKQLNGDYSISGSLNISGGITGSIDYSNITNKPTLISGSSQIEITGTTGYSDFSSSISTSIGELSSSIATTTNNLDGRLDSIEGVSGSYATTGSNQFNGNQSISGSLTIESFVTASSLHIVSSSTPGIVLDNTTDNNQYHINYGQIGYLNIHHDNGVSAPIAKFGTSSIFFTPSLEVSGSLVVATGSNIQGDGSGLYNIPASGVTGLQLNKIVSGSVSASIHDGALRVNSDVFIGGILTANELHIDYVTSSVLYQSGSTKFGDTQDDIHQFTGSVDITGSLYLNGVVVGTGKLDEVTFNSYTASVNPRISALETESGSIRSNFNSFTSSYTTGSFTGSFIGNATGLTNVPFHISGSDVNGNQSDKTFTKLHFDSDTGLNVSESAPGTAFISIGSHFKDIFVSGSPILSATGSDAFEIIPTGGVEITTSITDTNGNGYVKELNISTTTLSSSLNNRINTITGSLNSFTSSVNTFTSSINTFTSSVVLTSQTSSMNVLSSSYALTASYVLNGGGGGTGGAALGTYSSLIITDAASTWSFEHNTGQRFPIFQVFDNDGYVVIPSQIRAINDNNAEIIFPSPQVGRVVASLGGGNGTTEAFTNSALWTVDHNLGTDYPDVTVWDSNRNIVFPNRIESVSSNQIKIYFSQPISGNVSVSRGGHLLSGSSGVGLDDFTWANLLNKPNGLVSGSSQLTGSFDTRYVLSGSITQTTWDNIANKPSGLISGSIQVELTGTTGYSTFSSSISTSIGSLSSSIASTNLSDSQRIGSIESKTGSYATTGSNTFINDQTISGSLYVTQNLVVLGSSSITYVTASQLSISSSVISVNVFEPVERFGGLKVYDSGSSSATASLLWDSLHNHWIYENVSGSNYVSSMFIAGPRNTGSLGDEPSLTNGRIVKSVGGDHIDNSIIFETGTTINVEGSLTATALTGSIDFSNLTNIPTLVSGSEQLTGSYDTRYVLSGSITQTTWDNIASKPDGIISGSSQIVGLGFLQTSSFNTMSSSINTRVETLETSDYNQDAKLSSLINKTGSYATTGSNSLVGNQRINGNLSVTGSLVISGSLDLSSANIDNSRYLHTQTTGSTTWTIYHNLNYDYPNVTVYDADNKIMIPADVTSIDTNTTEVTFATAESGHALVSIGGISTGAADRFLYTSSPAFSTWTINHNLGYKYVNVDVYDLNDEQLIPQKVTAISENTLQIDFATPTGGNAIITIGGARSTSLFVQTGSFYTATTNIGITGSLVVTGDVDANTFNTTSDKKLKTNLVRIESALDKIEKLNGYTFDWLEEYSEDRTRQIGMVADEVYEVQPELISNRTIMLGGKEEQIKLLDYSKVTALLLEAIKELNDKVKKLENK